MNKLVLTLAALSVFSSSYSQIIYNNAVARGLTEEGLRTGPRAGGGSWSEVQYGNGAAGFRGSINPGANDRLADDFYVPSTGWHVTGASFFMYQTDATTATINNGLFEIRKNNLGSVGNIVGTGSFQRSAFTDIFPQLA